MENKHLGQSFKEVLYKTLKEDDEAVYHYIKSAQNTEELIEAIKDVAIARWNYSDIKYILNDDI